MAIPRSSPAFCVLLLSLSILLTLSLSFYSFSPVDNHLVNCGSDADSTVDNRRFVADSASTENSPFCFSARTICVQTQNRFPGLPQIYHTARVFTRPSKYVFNIADPGTHMVRFHFYRFNSSKFDSDDAQFHVLVNGYVVLRNYSDDSTVTSPRVKEYLIWVNDHKLVIAFIPSKRSKFAFVNAIEVISAPNDLVLDTAQAVNGGKIVKFDGLSKQALEVVHRINVGGPKVTPFNDTLWRTWVPDDDLFKSIEISKKVYFSGRISYQSGGASREVGPDFVYKSARVITSTNASIPYVNMTWELPISDGYKYLVRLHFCDIASVSLGLIYFNVYVNGYLVYKDLDLTDLTNGMLAAPFYADFVLDGDSSGVLQVSVGPSNLSMAYAVDGILNGVEVMKLNNSVGSLDGEGSAEMVLKSWPRGNMGVLVPLLAAVCLLLSIYVVLRRKMAAMRRRMVDARHSWMKLPVDIPAGDTKLGNQPVPDKA